MTQQGIVAREQPLSGLGRLLIALVGCVLLLVWGIACWLEPDSRGFGTHQRLGLPPCSFMVWTGKPCPSCGMTTAFANLARGRVLAALRANPGGFLVALTTLFMAPWSLASAKQGRLIGVTAPERLLFAVLLPVIGVTLVVWVVRLASGSG